MMKLFLAILSLSLVAPVAAQLKQPCGHQSVLDHIEKKYPGYLLHYDNQYSALAQSSHISSRKILSDTVFTVRVVFHVLYNNSAENIHDSLLYNQLDVLNQDFRRLNADTLKTRSIFTSRAGDARIQFVLASNDPSGNPSSGILRKATTTPYFGTNNGQLNSNMKFSNMGGNDAWDTDKYLNIWVCDLSYNGSVYVLGFAYPPFNHPFWTLNPPSTVEQGVVMHYEVTGRNNPRALGVMALSNKGRVAIHEVGHYLGLRHISGDGSGGSGCSVDDYLYDTPNQRYQSSYCPLGQNSCTDASNDLPDMVENYMDYSSHSCQNMFTKQQISVMRQSLVLYRPGIASREISKWRIIDNSRVYVHSGSGILVELTDDDKKKEYHLQLFDVTGKLLLSAENLNENVNEISLDNVATGTYIAVLIDSEGKTVQTTRLFFYRQ